MPTIVANFVSSISTKKKGDFASKMWSSYTQLNPGVYSEAIATEFKRRMKPDYVEYLLGLKGDAFVDSNLDGLADQFTTLGAGNTYSIVTGNGFSSNAQRVQKTDTTYLALRVAGVVAGSSNTYTFTYRSNKPIIITNSNIVLPANTGNAISYTFSAIFAASYTSLTFSYGAPTEVGDWIEIGDLKMVSDIPSNYFSTFGPSGLNKTTADWIGIMVTANNTLAGANTKTGAVMKWNLDGTIVTQNNLPAYTKGANAGIITFTSIDTFLNLTTFDCKLSNLIHLSGLYSAVNIAVLNCRSNQLGYLTTYAWTKLVDFQCYSNLLTSINNTGSNKISVDNEQLNLYSTEMVNSRLAYYNAMFAVTPPIKNLTLNLSGATMGIPTGAGNNTDLLGILAKFTAAGFTATIIVRTS